MADAKKLETWKNVTPAQFYIKQVDRFGDIVDMSITPGKTFHLSPEDRRLNQELAAVSHLDVFSNGAFSPVKLIDTEEDSAEIASNPNLVGESDMHAAFKNPAAWKAFSPKLDQIGNSMTLQRLAEIAVIEDATVTQVKKIQARLDVVNGVVEDTQPAEVEQISPDGTVRSRPVSPH